MHIGLYFGSFNPVHNGHLSIAEEMYRQKLFDAVWFVVTPNSPFKEHATLLDERKRLELVNIALKNIPYCRASDIEFNMTRPSYTYLTLRKLRELYPHYIFSIIMGEDNLNSIEKWKNYEEILQNHSIYVYPRVGVGQKKELKNVFYINLPLLNISSSMVRERLKNKENVQSLLPEEVINNIEKESFYL